MLGRTRAIEFCGYNKTCLTKRSATALAAFEQGADTRQIRWHGSWVEGAVGRAEQEGEEKPRGEGGIVHDGRGWSGG